MAQYKNQDISDLEDSGYTDYSGSMTWTSTGTNPAIGNGTLQGWYTLVGKMCHYYGKITPGSTTTFGTGNYQVSLPVDNAARATNLVSPGSWIRDSSPAGDYFGLAILSSNYFQLRYNAGASTLWGLGNPFTMVNGDWMSFNIHYEVV